MEASVEQLILLASAFWLLSANRPFISAVLQGRSLTEASAWGFGAAMAMLVFALHVLLLGLVSTTRTVKPVLAVVAVATALAAYYMNQYGVFLDPTMLRNAMRSDPAEARELLSVELALQLALYAGLPLLLLIRVRVLVRPWRAAVVRRLVLLAGAAACVVLTLMTQFQPLSSLMRNHREIRYLITPANYLWSAGAVLAADARAARAPRRAIGLDAVPGPSWVARKRPLVMVVVVGETARAANWGLSGYARQTTPRLGGLSVVNFPDVHSCGTNTEVSLPCMFAPTGRRGYNEARIRSQESLLHVAMRAGVQVHWRDNQGGCEGVCDGLPTDAPSAATSPGLCAEGRCFDESLVGDVDARLHALTAPGAAPSTQLWVLHMLGNHGPAYFRRYPPAFGRFHPTCQSDELRSCSREEIVNAYDNALLYTDHVLASAIERLQAHSAEVDSALLFVSDHGESLGEQGLFLHGVPYLISPDQQTRVPMVFWSSPGFAGAAGLDPACLMPELQSQSARPQTHDALFHTLLGLLDVRTALHEAPLDLVQACRTAPG